jgi:hypothetical protein
VCSDIICTSPGTRRSLDAATLARIAAATGAPWRVAAFDTPAAALDEALRRSARVVVAGSIFLTGPVRGILRAR